MLFSCKITNSLIISLDRRNEDLTVFYENCDWPSEFLRDPASWLEADKMEQLLAQIEAIYARAGTETEPLISAVGHESKDLRAWGVLDSVLRMVQTPKDLFAQPERFLSYFVSPAPPVGDIQRASDSVRFVLPISAHQYPRVTSFLRAALEALPTYIGKPMASVVWDDSIVTISWSESQASLFGEVPTQDLSLNPELVRNIVADLEKSQKELEETKKRLLEAEHEVELARSAPVAIQSASTSAASAAAGNFSASAIDEAIGTSLHELYRLGDYFARSQQLVTLLIAQGRQTPPVQEAMRRVDWPTVCETAPVILRQAIDDLVRLRDQARTSNSTTSAPASQRLEAQTTMFADKPKRRPSLNS
ncbi:MAG: hypothetical protein AAB250_05500 [Bdellovibrionota bacterium]